MEFEMGQISGNHNRVYKNAIWKYVFNNMPMGSVSNLNLSFILVGSGQKRGKFTPSKSSNCNFHFLELFPFWNGANF